jgi:hypothetical protein
MDRTDLKIDKPLANGCSLDVRATGDALRALREKHGSKSAVGRHCTTMLSQLRNLPGYVQPEWATHDSQTLQRMIRWQMAQLERALAAS